MGLRLLLVSNAPFCNTGYGTQIAQLGKHLRDAGHQVAFFANYGLSGSKTVWEGFPVYPSALSAAGDDLLHGHADHWKADVVLILFDAFAMDGTIQRRMKQLVMTWAPVDCEPLGQRDLMQFQASGAQPVAMSKFGQDMMENAGLDPLYAPHGIDTQDVFLPAEDLVWKSHGNRCSRVDGRAQLRLDNGIPSDAFVVGMNIHNKDAERKAVFEQMTAFALLHRSHKDTLLLCHTMPHPVMSGTDLIGLADYLGIADAVRWADPYSLLTGDYTPQDMAKWYAQLDLYSGASRGEGFGIPLIEAQACGVPVVTTDASAMHELVGPGWLVSGQSTWLRGQQATWTTPDIGGLLASYREAYDGGAAARSDDARRFALQYDADAVYARYWEPIWKVIERRLTDESRAARDSGWKMVK